jgi:polyhydroxybutyrate depolymerase
VDGLKRTFLLDLSDHWQREAALVMVFHGFTDNAENMRKEAGFTPLVAQYGFIAVYPQGTCDAKGNTYFSVGYAFHDNKVNDVGFARQLAARLVADLHLDPRAVFATGMSNGGDMSYLLGCQPKPFVRAIAPVAGTMMTVWNKKPVGQTLLPVLAVHGTNDKTTLWASDPTNRDGWGAYFITASGRAHGASLAPRARPGHRSRWPADRADTPNVR